MSDDDTTRSPLAPAAIAPDPAAEFDAPPSTPPVDAPPSTPPDPTSEFDALKLPQDYDKRFRPPVLTNVPLRKPLKHEFIFAHATWQQGAAVLKLRGDRSDELWIVANALLDAIPADLVIGVTFVPFMSRQGALAMWPLRAPREGRRTDAWAVSALAIADVARTTWVQVYADLPQQAYSYRVLPGVHDAPEWPNMSWTALRELAFRPWLISTMDHPTLDMVLRGK